MTSAKLLGVLALLALPAAAAAAAQDHCGAREPAPGLLVSVDWLLQHRKDPDLVILHAERTRAAFDSAHVAGARFIAPSEYTVTRGPVLYELPPAPRLDSLFESLGIGDAGRIVLYGDVLPVTRLFFTLDYLGLGERVSLLDGGVADWRAAGGAVTALPTPPAERTMLTIHPQPELLVDADWIHSHLRDSAVTLLDVRSPEEFDGTKAEEAVARPGHIPGARNLDWTTTVNGARFRGKAELQELLTRAGAAPGATLVTYCRVGSRASAVYFVARLLGYPVKLYDGSMNEWAGRADLPVAGPRP
jgi:thiosulfate/3-mercaptopyruvate sulfurtransferase